MDRIISQIPKSRARRIASRHIYRDRLSSLTGRRRMERDLAANGTADYGERGGNGDCEREDYREERALGDGQNRHYESRGKPPVRHRRARSRRAEPAERRTKREPERDATAGLTAADVLAELPFSRRVAEKRFRAATGKTILEEIQDVRFEKICELLATDIPIGHIAGRCGMQSDSFLKRFFKARTGMTLREWRNARRD